MHGERDRRTGGQRVFGRNRDVDSNPERSLSDDDRVNTKEIARASRLISKLTGITVQPNKAVVGANAFAHSSGIHQDGVLKSRTTYEIMNPADVGVEESALLLTARSGRNGVQNRLKHLGYSLTAPKLEVLFAKFKTLADKKKYVFDDDLLALVEEEGRDKAVEAFHLDYMSTTSGTGIVPTATVRLKKEDDVFQEASCRGRSCGRRRTAPWTKSPG
jgi:2-isopropylmalate synthase